MATEYTAVTMHLVNDDVAQILKYAAPSRMIREDACVEHVRVRNNYVPAVANCSSSICRRITVIGPGSQWGSKLLRQGAQGANLILAQRLLSLSHQGAEPGSGWLLALPVGAASNPTANLDL